MVKDENGYDSETRTQYVGKHTFDSMVKHKIIDTQGNPISGQYDEMRTELGIDKVICSELSKGTTVKVTQGSHKGEVGTLSRKVLHDTWSIKITYGSNRGKTIVADEDDFAVIPSA